MTEWYQNPVIMTFLGVILGSLISVLGTAITAKTKISELNLQHKNELKMRNLELKKEIYEQMILLTSTKCIECNGKSDFENNSYLLLAKAKIYCGEEPVKIYERFIEESKEGQNDRELVEEELLSAIKKDLDIIANG